MGTALVTGGAKRIGRHISLALAEAGHFTLVHSNSTDSAEVVETIVARGGSARSVTGDLTNDAELKLIQREFIASPAPRFLINNASIFREDAELDEIGRARMFAVNVTAPRRLSGALADVAETGVIVNILDSGVGLRGPGFANYDASRQELRRYSGEWARELAPSVRVASISVGPVLPPEGRDQSYLDEKVRAVPLGVAGTCDDVSSAVMFVVGCEFVTGACIHVDGGQHLLMRNRND